MYTKREVMGSFSLKATCFLVFLLVASALSQNSVCPFDFLYHLGDGVFDNGNSIRIPPFGPRLPAAKLPYGQTTPGIPTGRWCDGLLDIDIGAIAMGFPELTPYLGGNATSNNAIIFAVARSPVLDRSFFRSRGVRIPPYATSLNIQMSWFKAYLNTICSTPTDCADKVANSLVLFGDVEANDITIPLIQGKSIREVRRYVSSITQTQIKAAREVIRLGGTRVILPGNVPIGCYPFVLTELGTINPESYDDFGCLKRVNDLIVYKNNHLQKAISDLSKEFPDIMIFYADFYSGYIQLLQETIAGSNKNTTLQACCGVGGKYNYDINRFCGAQGVPICHDPSQYIHWDGIHLTEDANNRLSLILQVGAMEALKCTTSQSNNPILQVVGMEKFKSSPKLIRM